MWQASENIANTPIRGDRRVIFGWAMYDWANSAYVTTLAVAILPIYFAGVVVPPDGLEIRGTLYAAETLWGFMVSAAAFLVFVAAPTLGAIADFCCAKKRFFILLLLSGRRIRDLGDGEGVLEGIDPVFRYIPAFSLKGHQAR